MELHWTAFVFNFVPQRINRTPPTIRPFTGPLPGLPMPSGACDAILAGIFGGPNAIAAGSGYEPVGVPCRRNGQYRGAGSADGHLDNAMHLYGSRDGSGTTNVYIPDNYSNLRRNTRFCLHFELSSLNATRYFN